MFKRSIFHDEKSRRQWESSIGIIHASPTLLKDSVEPNRLYLNPLKERSDRALRPVSPLLNLDADRVDMDEYADVAGHFFSDVMPVKVPSRAGRRPAAKKTPGSSSGKLVIERIYAQPSSLPRLKGGKQVKTTKLNEKISAFFQEHKHTKSSQQLSDKDITESVAFDRSTLFDGKGTACLTPFDHTAYATIPAKLFKYEDTVDSSESKDNSCADLSIPYNVGLMHLKTTIIEIVFGRNRLGKNQFKKAFRKLKVWVYLNKKKQWIQVTSDDEWTHSKLVAQEVGDLMRLMYSLQYTPGAGGSTSAGSMCSSASTPWREEGMSSLGADDYSTVASDDTGLRFASSKLRRLDCHTPNPPRVQIGSILLPPSDACSDVEAIPKEKYMANILESRLMISRYN